MKAGVSLWKRFLAFTGLWTSRALPQGLTPNYLTQVFRRNGVLKTTLDDVKANRDNDDNASAKRNKKSSLNSVTGIRFHPMECGAIGEVKRVELSYADDEKAWKDGAPKTAVLKCLGTNTRSVLFGELLSVFHMEFLSFEHLPPVLPPGTMPKVWAKEKSWHGQGWILMEDYSHFHQRKSRHCSATFEEAAAILKKVATIHGSTWQDVELGKKYFFWKPWVMHQVGATIRQFAKSAFLVDQECPLLKETLTLLAATMGKPEGLFNRSMRFLRRDVGHQEDAWLTMPDMSFLTSHPDTYVCICHGDVRLDNTFFEDVGDSDDILMLRLQQQLPRRLLPTLSTGKSAP